MPKTTKRPYGTGSLRINKAGKWEGSWRTADGRHPKRILGLARKPGTSSGITRAEAEEALRKLIAASEKISIRTNRSDRTVANIGALAHQALVAQGKKKAYVEGFESELRIHINPALGSRQIDRLELHHIEKFMAKLMAPGYRRAQPLAPKTVCNIMKTLYAVFEYAQRQRPPWVKENLCRLVIKPNDAPLRGEAIVALTLEEVEAVLRAIDSGNHGVHSRWALVDRVIILMAAMTGMRQGELLAILWREIDWVVQKARVRRNYVRGEFGAPKSRRSSRALPLATRLLAALDELSQATPNNRDAQLVFSHPELGTPLDRSALLKRLKRYYHAAGIRCSPEAKAKPFEELTDDERRGLPTFHDLRHTFGTICASKGIAMRKLQEWYGHRSSRTTDIYVDYAPGPDDVEAVERAFAIDDPTAQTADVE
jgi:integrase